MKINVDREPFLKAFATTASFAPAKPRVSVLGYVKASIEPAGLYLYGSDSESGIRVEVAEAQCTGSGAILLDRAKVGAILNQSRDESITFNSDGANLEIRGKTSRFKLNAPSADEYPTSDYGDPSAEVTTSAIIDAINKTHWASDEEATRYALNGIRVIMRETVTLVATDGRRLAVAATAAKCGDVGEATIPGHKLRLFAKALADHPVSQWTISDRGIYAAAPSVQMFAVAIDGRYPNWQAALPKRDGHEMSIPAGEFLSAVRQAAIVSSADSNGVDLRLSHAEIEISGAAAEVGTSSVTMPASYSGDEITVTLNHLYVQDFLRVCNPASSVDLWLPQGSRGPALFVCDGLQCVVMPIDRK